MDIGNSSNFTYVLDFSLNFAVDYKNRSKLGLNTQCHDNVCSLATDGMEWNMECTYYTYRRLIMWPHPIYGYARCIPMLLSQNMSSRHFRAINRRHIIFRDGNMGIQPNYGYS